MLLESSEQRPGMLLKILQCTGQSPTTKNYLVPNVNSAEVEEPCAKRKKQTLKATRSV